MLKLTDKTINFEFLDINEIINKRKKTQCEKIFSNKTDKMLISKIYKLLIKLSVQKQPNS